MSLVPLQTSHPKSSCNKGLGRRLGKLKTLHWKLVSRCLQPGPVQKRGCFVRALPREPEDCACSGRAAGRQTPPPCSHPTALRRQKQPAGRRYPRLNPHQVKDKASLHILFSHGESPSLIQRVAQARGIPQRQQHPPESFVQWQQTHSL